MKKDNLNKKRLQVAVWVLCTIFMAGPLVIADRLHAAAASAAPVEWQEAAESLNINKILSMDLDMPRYALGAGEKAGVPVRINIPSIAVDAVIEKVAKTRSGSMDVPKDPFNAGWYELGSRPGEKGSATIAGHLNSMVGDNAVFTNLHKLKPGDKIEVQDDKGAVVSFVVRESRMYDAAVRAVDVFTSKDGKPHLNLITCDGEWDERAQRYSKRLVVFADIETE